LARDQQALDEQGGSAEAQTASADASPAASALVFDLPVAQGLPPINFDRASREPGAFVGYEEPSVEYHSVFIYSSQSTGIGGSGFGDCLNDGYQRVDVIQRSSVRYR
jgi:hypothetical protein